MENTDNPIVVEVTPQMAYDMESEAETEYQVHMRTKPWLFQAGKPSANPAGRPKGMTMKEWTRNYLASLTDTERLEYLKGIPKIELWRMAEGNPTEDKTLKITVPQPILGGISQLSVEEQEKLKAQNALQSGLIEEVDT